MEKTAYKIISSAADCNISIFINCKFHNNLFSLVIFGDPDDDELKIAWEKIHIEFCDISGSSVPELDSMRAIMHLQCRNKSVELYFLAIKDSLVLISNNSFHLFNSNLTEILLFAIENIKIHGISLKYPSEDFNKQLQMAQSREKLNHIRLEEMIKSLEIEKELERKKRPTPQNEITLFYRMLNNLEAHGYKIDEEKTNVYRLAIMIKDYSDYLERSSRNN